MAAKKFQQVLTYTWNYDGHEQTSKASYASVDAAIKKAYYWIDGADERITVTHVEVINKETKEVVWKYEA